MVKTGFIRFNDYSFVDEIVSYNLEDYFEVRDAYVDYISQFPDVKSVYQMGGISSPGISDLDLLVVTHDELQNNPMALSMKNLDDKARYIFWHEPYVMNESTFKNYNLLDYVTNLTKVFGEELICRELSNSDTLYIRVIILTEGVVRLLHRITTAIVSRRIFVRGILLFLHSIKYSLEIARGLGIKVSTEADAYVGEIIEFRNNWLSIKDYRKLLELVTTGFNILIDLASNVSEALLGMNIIKITPSDWKGPKYVFNSYNEATVFTKNPLDIYDIGERVLGRKNISIKAGGRYLNATLSIVWVPQSFYYHYTSYTKGSGWYSKYLKRLFIQNGAEHYSDIDVVNESYQDVIKKRVEAWEKYLNFASSGKLSSWSNLDFFGHQRSYSLQKVGLTRYITRNIPFSLLLLHNKIYFRLLLKELNG